MDDELRTLEVWLQERLPDARGLRLSDAGKPGSGFSAETTILDATWDSGRDRFVLRKETPEEPVYPTQVPGLTTEVEIQYRVMHALAGGDVPLAPLVGYEADSSVLGSPFFVMGFVDGVVPIESPMYTLEGFFLDLRPEQRIGAGGQPAGRCRQPAAERHFADPPVGHARQPGAAAPTADRRNAPLRDPRPTRQPAVRSDHRRALLPVHRAG